MRCNLWSHLECHRPVTSAILTRGGTFVFLVGIPKVSRVDPMHHCGQPSGVLRHVSIAAVHRILPEFQRVQSHKLVGYFSCCLFAPRIHRKLGPVLKNRDLILYPWKNYSFSQKFVYLELGPERVWQTFKKLLKVKQIKEVEIYNCKMTI